MSKKMPVLVGNVCYLMEMLRLANEVFTGKRTSFVCLDLNTSHGTVRLGEKEAKVRFISMRDDLVEFELDNGGWNVGLLDADRKQMRVASDKFPSVRKTIAGDCSMRWVGTSLADRREEPLFLENFEHCAKVRGMTLHQLLDS